MSIQPDDWYGSILAIEAEAGAALREPCPECVDPVFNPGYHYSEAVGYPVPVQPPATEPRPDLCAIDRLLAVEHREDDEPCACDACMGYVAEDAGADWNRMPVANRIAIRILDGGDDRLADLAIAFQDHDAAAAPMAMTLVELDAARAAVPGAGLREALDAMEATAERLNSEAPQWAMGLRFAVGIVRARLALATPSPEPRPALALTLPKETR